MDTSEIYIKQCEKAVEIHEAWEPTTSDFVVLRGCKEVNVVGLRDFKEVRVPEDVWLPRQDQLQILSGLSWQEFDRECLKYNAPTKEQAGIQVVMKILAKTIQ